ncbi:MAG: glyoxalase superfamily protein, partial [Alphaproteobacteria bacterium]|nr:glyoxalase superfamily protein [Alphaproteobacteria bacterium]
MNGSLSLPSIADLKVQARRLRAKLETDGTAIGHGRSLELLAQQYGYKDWNTLHASVGNRGPRSPVTIGEKVRGHYLGQAFAGTVLGVHALSAADRFRVTLEFDAPVDVVMFESFSAFRKRVSCTID